MTVGNTVVAHETYSLRQMRKGTAVTNTIDVKYVINRVDAIKAGKDYWGAVIARVAPSTLTEAQRVELALCAEKARSLESVDICLPIQGTPVIDDSRWPTITDSHDKTNITNILDARIAIRAERDAARAKEDAERTEREAAEYAEELQKILTQPIEDFLTLHAYRPEDVCLRPYYSGRKAYNSPEMAEKRAAIEAHIVREKKRVAEEVERAAEAHRLREVAIAAEEERQAALAVAWIEQHGSALLKARLAGEADGFEWWPLLKVEWLNSMLAGVSHGGAIPYDEDWMEPRSRPTLSEIKRFNAIRTCLLDNGVEVSTANLVHLTAYNYDDPRTEYCRPYPGDGCTAVELSVVCFGNSFRRYVILFDTKQTDTK